MLKNALCALPFFALGAMASNTKMASDIGDASDEAQKDAREKAKAEGKPVDEADPRSFGSLWAQEIIESIDSYGCWCYFQDNHGKGKGTPANEVDNQCKILHDGYTCILMDAELEGEDCTPWDVQYNSASGLGLLANDDANNATLEDALRFKCKKVNKRSNCAARACMVENYFVVRMVRLFLHSVPFDPSLKHDLGHFDPKVDCPTKEGVKSDKECCGEYPLRFPYKHLNGDRACCVDRTYNTNVLMCCDDGSVKIVC